MSILPQFDTSVETIITDTTSSEELPIPVEYAWDFDNNDFLLNNGKFVMVKGLDAIKIWIWKALKTSRYKYTAYSWNYGHELETLIGQGFSIASLKSEAERLVKEALMINPYITGITNMDISFNESILKTSFTVKTPYGEVNINV